MAPVELRYLELFRSRNRVFAYYRRDGMRVRLRGEAGNSVDPSDRSALVKAWTVANDSHEAANRAGKQAADDRVVLPRSIADLIAKYRASPEWAEKQPATKLDYEKGLRPLERDFGRHSVERLQRKHITQIRDKYAFREVPVKGEPGKTDRVSNARQANRVVTMLSILLSYSIDPLGWRNDNPALNPKRLKRQTDGYAPWSVAQFERFYAAADPEWQLAAMLALLTAQRGQDQVAMTWADYDGQRMYVVQQKGNGYVKLWIYTHPALKKMLDARLKAHNKRQPVPRHILCRADGNPWPVNAFQKAAGKAIKAAGLTGVVWHGLRGAAMSWAAEGGASQRQLMALSGHSTSGMADHYVRGADQERLAQQAVNAIALPASVTRRPKK